MKRTRTLLLVGAVAVLPCLVTAEDLSGPALPIVRVHQRSHAIGVSTTLVGRNATALFLVDLSSPELVYDLKMRSFLDELISDRKEPVYAPPPLDCGECVIHAGPAVCRDLTSIRQRTGLPVDGLLGYEHLIGLGFRSDRERGTFQLQLYPYRMKGSEFKILAPTRAPQIRALVGGTRRDTRLHPDCWSRCVLSLGANAFDELVQAGEIQEYGEDSVDLWHDGIVSQLIIGSEVYHSVPVRRADRGTLGLLLFQNDTLWVDLAMCKGSIERDTAARGKAWVPWHGMAVWKPKDAIVIEKVAPRGPAGRAGLAAGDVIESINGNSARHLATAEVEFHDAWDAGRVEIEYLRSGEKHKAVVVRDARPEKQ